MYFVNHLNALIGSNVHFLSSIQEQAKLPVHTILSSKLSVFLSCSICINRSQDCPALHYWEYFLFASEQVCAVADKKRGGIKVVRV